ncbi:hypothetical protein X798_00167 [Onchocerca flexuosa]|uniref:RING-type domain-containing protein n=2 Tax=Onchocerca flexuosa TaxID=387005 RepID=A0A238C5M2_9BILA|nr:hypothetical protein X798_00167 [Onchocerca flexuosa]
MDFFTPECSSNGTKTAKEMREDEQSSLPLTHLFVELTSLEELSFPTSSSTRIKFTCLDASAHYLAVGSTSGTVYLFSRFASKYRNRISSVPIQVISIKDGPIIKLSLSPDEKYLATASKRGSLTITVLVGIGQNPITLFSTDSHVGIDEYGQSIHITELCWCNDSSKVYAGDTKGRISRTLIHNRNFFRSPTDIIFETDSEIVQFDLHDDYLLASTLTRCCVCDLRTYSCIQVGKRLRKGRFGAIFYSDQQKRKSLSGEENNCIAPMNTNGYSGLTVIFASRPNGRLWEANGCGVVYSTHQYRNLKTVCRFPVISFKDDNLFNSIANVNEIRSINFGLLTLIRCQNNLFLMTKTDTTFCLIDPVDSHLVLMSTVDCIGSVSEYAVNDADIFLLSETGSLRKLTLFTVEKAVEKLHWRQCYLQAAQLIYVDYIMNKNYNSVTVWDYKQLEDILNKITFQHLKSHVTNDVFDVLHKLLSESKKNGTIEKKPKAVVRQLNSGIHRVVQVMQNSGYEDDFTFRAPSPLRLRSKSTLHIKIKNDWKRKSLPLNRDIMIRTGEDEIKLEDPEERRKKLINEARILLLDLEKIPKNQLVCNGSVESLRTLLESSNSLILFDHQVTIDDVTKDLVIAKKFQRLIGDHKIDKQKQRQRTMQVDFKTLFGRRDPLEMLEKCVESMPLSINVNVAHLRTIRRTRRGARIVKGIKPLGRRNVMPEIEYENSECCEWISEQQSIKRDLTSSESLNLNCNETPEGDESSKHSSNDQSSENDIGLLNKSYVVEKNFVAVQPIEMTWTMNGDDEDNDSIGMKSLEATMTLNGGDKSLMQSSEVTIASKILSAAEKLDEKDLVYCQVCGLHRLWHYVMTFGPKMSQLRVTVDLFAVGGVPTSIEQWTKLFEYRIAAVKSDDCSSENLCDTCAAFFEFDDQLKQKASSLREMVERINKRSVSKKCTGNLVQMMAKEWDEDLVYRIFFKKTTILTKKSSGIQKKINVSSHFEISRKELEFDECSKNFLWLPTVKISQLLLSMCNCESLSTVFEFLKNNEKLASCLTIEDWQWLAVMKAYEYNRFLDIMPKEVITDLLTELKISEIEDIGSSSSSSTCSVSSVVNNSKSLSGSLTVSVDGNCICCTLPLKMRVTQNDDYITIFRCGHLYHRICLREANLSRCLRCEVERRRYRQKQQQMGSRADATNPSHSSSARNSRHLSIKPVRKVITSSPSMKVPQRT